MINPIPSEIKLTPLMKQYQDVKKNLPEDVVLLFRLGDFYELFFHDASVVAPILEITLTKRQGMPMCGIPYHALDSYLPQLLNAGLKVAIAEQLEDPRTAKGIVKRDVTRIITPGTISDAALMTNNNHTFICTINCIKETWGLASLDFSTGDFLMTQLFSLQELNTEIARLHPKEILLPETLFEEWKTKPDFYPETLQKIPATPIPDYLFTFDFAEQTLKQQFKVKVLDAFGVSMAPIAAGSAAATLYYVKESLRQQLHHIRSLRLYHPNDSLILDPITLRHLELVEPLSGHAKEHTLIFHLDHTGTPMGARLLRDWVLRPLGKIEPILERLTAVDAFVSSPLELSEIQETICEIRDLERIVSRIHLNTASPRDLLALLQSLQAIPHLKILLESFESIPLLSEISKNLFPLPELVKNIEDAIVEAPPNNLSEGGIIKLGYNADLDHLRNAASDGKSWLANIQVKEQQKTSIKNLKVLYNRVFGYYIEISKSNLHLVPQEYIRKQTLANCERFITPELKELESTILGAEEKAKALEYELFIQLRQKATQFTDEIQSSARATAQLDALISLADISRLNGYVKPHITEEIVLDFKAGRHPVLDLAMKDERFVPNDTFLDDENQRIMIITGPNMAGKSTYIRQTALLTIMAQIGCFVPADSATVGIVDRIFTRIGAADDLARGQSTFMVEMVETANILNHATHKSLVILDEIGRGTSTFDGLAIAWAITEFLHDHPTIRPRTQFATHYHELTELALTRKAVKNFSIAVQEYGDQIIFLRQIVPGGADKSYGIQVAQLAGLPLPVIGRAFEILDNLERHSISASGIPTLAEERSEDYPPIKGNKKVKRLRKLDPDEPIQPSLFNW